MKKPSPTVLHAERREVLARLHGRRIVASVSGGKDSAAMSLYRHELGIAHDRVFLHTRRRSMRAPLSMLCISAGRRGEWGQEMYLNI